MHGFNPNENFREKQNSQSSPNNQKPAKSDYIDYEEVK